MKLLQNPSSPLSTRNSYTYYSSTPYTGTAANIFKRDPGCKGIRCKNNGECWAAGACGNCQSINNQKSCADEDGCKASRRGISCREISDPEGWDTLDIGVNT
jgi:hypothetical protein